MASLTGQTVSSTYDGLLKTEDNDILGASGKLITDGLGNSSGLTLSTTGDVSISGDLTVDGAILDSNGYAGDNGQILSSTGAGTDWIDLSEISGVDGSGTANYVPKWTDGDTIGNSVIYDDGTNVGIGTSSPAQLLHVTSAGSTVLFVEATGANDSRVRITAGDSNISYLEFGDTADSDTGEIRYDHSNDSMQFRTNANVERMRIDSSGNVGIGTSSPSDLLELSAVVPTIRFTDEDGGCYHKIAGGGNGDLKIIVDEGNTGSLLSNFIVSIDGSTALNIASGGDVSFFDSSLNKAFYWDASAASLGIGTDSPDTEMHLEGFNPKFTFTNTNTTSTGYQGIIFKSLDTAGAANQSIGRIEFETSDTSSAGVGAYIESELTAAGGQMDLAFATGLGGATEERMRIDSSGNINIYDGIISGTAYSTSAVVSASTIDFTAAQVFTKTMTGNTTFSITNAQIGMVKDLYLTGDYTFSITNGKLIAGTYDGTVTNFIQIVAQTTTSFWYSISQEQA